MAAELFGERAWTGAEPSAERDPELYVATLALGLSAHVGRQVERPWHEVYGTLRHVRALERKAMGGAVWETTVPSAEARDVLAALGLSAPPRSLPRPAR